MKPNLKKWLLKFLREEDGPTAVEYAIMLTAIILTCVGAIGLFGNATNALFTDIDQKVSALPGK